MYVYMYMDEVTISPDILWNHTRITLPFLVCYPLDRFSTFTDPTWRSFVTDPNILLHQTFTQGGRRWLETEDIQKERPVKEFYKEVFGKWVGFLSRVYDGMKRQRKGEWL